MRYRAGVKHLVAVACLVLGLGTALAKPTAPVAVRLSATPVKGGYQVTLIATATHDVPALVLALAGKRVAFPATRAGQVRTLVATVAVAPGAGVDVVGVAAAGGRNRAEIVHVGAPAKPAAPPPAITRTLPDGRDIAEVR